MYITGQHGQQAGVGIISAFNPGGTGGTLTFRGGCDGFLAKYDAGGNFQWVKSIEGTGYELGNDITIDAINNVYIIGQVGPGIADFNPGYNGDTLIPMGYDVFIAKYTAGGNFQWVKGMGGNSSDEGRAIALDGRGNIYATGISQSPTIDFNPGGTGGTFTNAGAYDVFLLKLGCSDTSSLTLTVSTCEAIYILNEIVYTESGTYTKNYRNAVGCDSNLTIELIIAPIEEPIISVDSFVLIATGGTYATYQWLKDKNLIPGAIGKEYTVTSNGDYQVVVTNEEGCSDTSAVYAITNYNDGSSGIEYPRSLAKHIHVYPNPADKLVYIETPVAVNIKITDIVGRLLKNHTDNATSVFIGDLAQGMYLLKITDKRGIVLKEQKLLRIEH